MFQYITTNILNRVEDIKRLYDLDRGDSGKFSASTHDSDALLIDGVGLFYAKNIEKVEFASFEKAENEVAELGMSTATVAAKDVLRLKIVTSQEGVNSAIYADAQLRHRKPFFYEVVSTGAIANDVKALVELINKDMAMTDFNFFKATDGTNGKLVLTADDCYTRFQEVELVKVNITSTNNTGYQDYTVLFSWDRKDKAAFATTITTKGSEGMGTVARIIKNIKLPTDANTDVFAADNGGRPLPGAEYDRYVLTYVTDRRHIGGQVMGARDRSETTHIFYAQRVAGTTTTGATTKSGTYDSASDAIMGNLKVMSVTPNTTAQTASMVTAQAGDKQ